MNRYLEYLIKDYIRKDESIGDGSEFTDERCEKVDVGVPSQLQEFLTSNTSHLKSLLVNTNGYIVKVVFHVFIYNNRFHTANIYELSLFLRYLLVKLPDEVFPFIRGDDVIEEG